MNIKKLSILSYDYNGISSSFDFSDICAQIFIGTSYGFVIANSITLPNYPPHDDMTTEIRCSLFNNLSGCTISIVLNYHNRTITVNWDNNGDYTNTYIHIWGIHAK